jgi:hypothetical protein
VIRLLADENFNSDILRGLRRRIPSIDAPRIQDVGMRGADDEAVLEWAAGEGRLVLTHDVSTLLGFAWRRAASGRRHSGVGCRLAVGSGWAPSLRTSPCSWSAAWTKSGWTGLSLSRSESSGALLRWFYPCSSNALTLPYQSEIS